MNKKIILILFFIVWIMGFGSRVQAAIHYLDHNSCGYNCNIAGDTYILTEDMNCDTDGLIVGSDNITIDGNSYTITGDGGFSDYGIDNSGGYNNITIQNFANITNFGRGIFLYNSTGSTIQNNTANSNFERGIFLYNSTGSTIQNNTANSNPIGIYLQYSSSNNLNNNTMSGNGYNLYIYGDTNAQYDNTIETTNLVDGKPVYYLYNQSDQTYDGDIIGDIGLFWCISCSNITVKNATLSANNFYGVYFRDTTNSTVQNVTANSSERGIYLFYSSSNTLNDNNTSNSDVYGIFLYSSSSNNLNNNIANSNPTGIYLQYSSSNNLNNNTCNSNEDYGIYFNSSSSNDLNNNTCNSNENYGIYFNFSSSNDLNNNTCNSNIFSGSYGIYLESSSSNTLTGNIVSINKNDIYDNGTNTYSNNQFLYNDDSKMLSFTEVTRIKNLNHTVSFDISMTSLEGGSCSDCVPAITTSPSETVTSSINVGNVTGSFTVSRLGTYSFIVTITDSNNNVTKKNYLFFVNASGSATIRYYFRGTNPTHGQPVGTDCKSLLLAAPNSTETWSCTDWIQNSPDELPTYPLPNYPLAFLSDVNINSWYKTTTVGNIGVQRFVTRNTTVDSSEGVPVATDYTWHNTNLTGLDWVMDYPKQWYWLSLKLIGSNPCWTTFPVEADANPASWAAHHHPDGSTDASYADFAYQYTTTPAIKSISDEDIMVLSATADPTDTGIINVVLEDLSTLDTSTMDIVLSSPVRLDLSFDAWNASAPYYKQWMEETSEPGIIATHTINGFAPNNYYMVTKDGALIGLYLSDASGQITFDAIAGSVFTIESINTVSQTENNYDDNDNYQCFLTTLFGLAMAKDKDSVLCKVRDFRDSYLLTNPIGKLFVNTYYKVSPHMAFFIKEYPILKNVVRSALNPLIWMSGKSVDLKSLN